jgi:hypothetical protein
MSLLALLLVTGEGEVLTAPNSCLRHVPALSLPSSARSHSFLQHKKNLPFE